MVIKENSKLFKHISTDETEVNQRSQPMARKYKRVAVDNICYKNKMTDLGLS